MPLFKSMDSLPTRIQLEHCAAQLDGCPPESVECFGDFDPNTSDEFLLGMLAGITSSIAISMAKVQGKSVAVLIPLFAAIVAKELLKREVLVKDARFAPK